MPTPRDTIASIAKTIGEGEPGVAVTGKIAELGRRLHAIDRRFTVDTVKAALQEKLRTLTGRRDEGTKRSAPARPITRQRRSTR